MFNEIGTNQTSWRSDWRGRFGEYFRQRAALNEARWFICERDGEIVGTACGIVRDGYPSPITGTRSGYILGVSVAPKARKSGVATKLTELCVEFLLSIGCSKILLHAAPAGRGVYERLGFESHNEMVLSAKKVPPKNPAKVFAAGRAQKSSSIR